MTGVKDFLGEYPGAYIHVCPKGGCPNRDFPGEMPRAISRSICPKGEMSCGRRCPKGRSARS